MMRLPAESVVTKQTLSLIAGACLLLAGCADNTDTAVQVEQPVEVLYRDALNTALAGDSKEAAPKFEEVERQHPYSELATRAQIMAAWSFYQANDYPRAEAALDRFVELNPADPLVDYAYYLKALCYYEQIVDVQRDAEMTKMALAAFEELIRRFPNGRYARDAQLKVDLTKSHLAGKEMAVGRFYQSREFYTAAIRRFKTVIKQYDTTNQVPEALYRLGESYLALGLVDEAERFYVVAAYNYPDSIWTSRLNSLRADPEKPPAPGLFERSINSITTIFD